MAAATGRLGSAPTAVLRLPGSAAATPVVLPGGAVAAEAGVILAGGAGAAVAGRSGGAAGMVLRLPGGTVAAGLMLPCGAAAAALRLPGSAAAVAVGLSSGAAALTAVVLSGRVLTAVAVLAGLPSTEAVSGEVLVPARSVMLSTGVTSRCGAAWSPLSWGLGDCVAAAAVVVLAGPPLYSSRSSCSSSRSFCRAAGMGLAFFKLPFLVYTKEQEQERAAAAAGLARRRCGDGGGNLPTCSDASSSLSSGGQGSCRPACARNCLFSVLQRSYPGLSAAYSLHSRQRSPSLPKCWAANTANGTLEALLERGPSLPLQRGSCTAFLPPV